MITIVGTRISEKLANDIQVLITGLRDDSQTVDNADIEDVVHRMTEESMRYQFVSTCEQLGLGANQMKLVNMSVTGALKATRYGLKKIVPKLSPTQRIELTRFLEDAVYVIE